MSHKFAPHGYQNQIDNKMSKERHEGDCGKDWVDMTATEKDIRRNEMRRKSKAHRIR